MSIRRPFIIGTLLLVACVVVWSAVFLVENRVENAVRERLEQADVACGNVRYRLLAGELVLEDVAWSVDGPAAREEMSARRIAITKPGRAAFDASTPGRPLVAKSIVARDVRRSSLAGEGQDSGMQWTVGEIRIEGWRQNLGRVMKAWRTHPRSEIFFGALLDYSADRFTYADVRGSLMQDGVRTEGGAGYVEVKDIREGVLSCEVADVFFSGDGLPVQGKIDRTAVTDLRVPSPALLAGLAEALSVPGTAAMEAGLEARLESLAREYVLSRPYGHVHLGNVALSGSNPETGERKGLVSATRIDTFLSADVPRSFGLAVEALFIPGAMAQMVRDAGLPDLGVADLFLDADMKVTAPDGQDMAMLAFDTEVRDLGTVTGEMRLKVPEASAASVASEPEAWLMQVAVGKSSFSCTDSGFAARLLRAGAAQAGMTPEAFLALCRERLSSSLRGVPVPGLDRAVMTMLEKPGTLDFQMSPRQPVSAMTFFMAVLFDPEFMGIQVSATPGARSILEVE